VAEEGVGGGGGKVISRIAYSNQQDRFRVVLKIAV
jgi:hypothetical protein